MDLEFQYATPYFMHHASLFYSSYQIQDVYKPHSSKIPATVLSRLFMFLLPILKLQFHSLKEADKKPIEKTDNRLNVQGPPQIHRTMEYVHSIFGFLNAKKVFV